MDFKENICGETDATLSTRGLLQHYEATAAINGWTPPLNLNTEQKVLNVLIQWQFLAEHNNISEAKSWIPQSTSQPQEK